MNRNDLVSRLQKVSRVQNNRFDISAGRKFTAPVGALIPCYIKELDFGNHISVDVSNLTRTIPMQRANYARMSENFDFYFVPFRLLFEGVQDMLSGAPHNRQSKNPVPEHIPEVSANQIYNYLYSGDYRDVVDDCGFQVNYGASRILNGLGYGTFTEHAVDDLAYPSNTDASSVYQPSASNNSRPNVFTGNAPSSWSYSILPLLAYNKIYQDYYRNKYWENENHFSYFMESDVTSVTAEDINSRGLLTLHYSNLDRDRIFGMLPDFNGLFSVGINALNVVPYTSDNEKFGTYNYMVPDATGATVRCTSVFQQVSAWVNGTSPDPLNWSLLQQGLNSLTGDDSAATNGAVSNEAAGHLSATDGDLYAFTAIQALTALNLRRMEALQRFAEIVALNKDDYKHQMSALFGKSVNDMNSDYCSYLGGSTNPVQVSDVINTSYAEDATNDNALGAMAGKGMAYGNSSHIDFTAPEHGYLICIYHVQPQIDYPANFIDPTVLRFERFDFQIPQFDSLGFEPVRICNIMDIGDYSSSSEPTVVPNPQLTVGWLPRYWSYKTDIDTCTGAFALDDSINGVKSYLITYDFPAYLKRIAWTPSYGNPIDYRFFKVHPSLVDNLFYTKYDGTVKTDEFIISAQFNAVVDLPLSVDGLPY